MTLDERTTQFGEIFLAVRDYCPYNGETRLASIDPLWKHIQTDVNVMVRQEGCCGQRYPHLIQGGVMPGWHGLQCQIDRQCFNVDIIRSNNFGIVSSFDSLDKPVQL